MLNNKKFNIIISLVIAVCLWAYVIGETNPKDTQIYRDVPIAFLNGQVLEDSNLAILEKSSEQLNVTIYGTRTALSSVDERDIVATVDLADAAKGTNELKVNIRVPDNVELDDKSINKVTVVVENRATKNVDVRVDYTDKFESDTEAITMKQSEETVEVSGAESQVKKVVYARATIDAEKVSGTPKVIRSQLAALSKRNAKVDNISLSIESVTITTVLAKVKTVPLHVPTIDNSKDGIQRDVTTPDTITIKGMGEDIDQIEEITATPIDLTDVAEDKTVQIEPILPTGIEVSATTPNLEARITVETIASKTFTFDGADVDITGLAEDFNAIVKTEKIQILITGDKKTIEALTKDDFTLSADLADLVVGNSQVTLNVNCKQEYAKMEINPVKIKVTIE